MERSRAHPERGGQGPDRTSSVADESCDEPSKILAEAIRRLDETTRRHLRKPLDPVEIALREATSPARRRRARRRPFSGGTRTEACPSASRR
jgi:hypothetical protein